MQSCLHSCHNKIECSTIISIKRPSTKVRTIPNLLKHVYMHFLFVLCRQQAHDSIAQQWKLVEVHTSISVCVCV